MQIINHVMITCTYVFDMIPLGRLKDMRTEDFRLPFYIFLRHNHSDIEYLDVIENRIYIV